MKVFVYGTLKSTQGAADLMHEGGTLVGAAETIEEYRMYDFGGFPGVVMQSSEGAPLTTICGEVWDIREDHMPRLHNYEGYRESDPENSLYIPRQVETTLGYATMYVFNGVPFSNRFVEDGNWSRSRSR